MIRKEVKTMPIYINGVQQVISIPKMNLFTVAKSNGEYSNIQDAIDAANPTVHSGTAQSGSATTITLAGVASTTNDYYNGMKIRLTGGTGNGQLRTIINYVGATKVASVASSWDTNPDNTSTYDVKSTQTVLVSQGEYDEGIVLADCVDVIADNPYSTTVEYIVDDDANCFVKLALTIAGGSLNISGQYSDVTLVGNIFGSTAGGALNVSNGGTARVDGDITLFSESQIAVDIDDANSQITINGDVFGKVRSVYDATDACTLNINGDVTGNIDWNTGNLNINGDCSCSLEEIVDISRGTVDIRNSVMTCTYNNANGHGLIISGGTLILQNARIVCTHASAESIYASTAQDAKCMGVWANRDDNANITQLITGGFTYDADVA
jgi:hypothetical protein